MNIPLHPPFKDEIKSDNIQVLHPFFLQNFTLIFHNLRSPSC